MHHLLAPLGALLLASAQDVTGPALVLETLDGTQTRQALDAAAVTDPRQSGAVFLRYEGLDAPQPAGSESRRATIRLHNGDSVRAWVRGGDDSGLTVEPARGVEVVLSIEEVASLIVPGRLPHDGSSTATPPSEGDRLYVQRGRGVDQIDGVLLGFTESGLTFEGRLGQREHPWDEVAALFVEDLDEDPPEPSEPFEVPVTVELVGGGRLSGGLGRMDAAGVTLLRRQGSLQLPAGLVGELVVDDGSYGFLSALPVADPGPVTLFGTGDELGMVYPHRVDRNCLDGPLTSGGRVWFRGLGVHAPSRLTWELDGKWKSLRALAAIDDSSLDNRHPGSALFRVWADGEKVWESPLLRGGDPPQALELSLAGVKQLVLEVDPATEAFVSDRGNWLRPILVR
jgi:NPCBM/NEW2 domain